jgi:hypothetical protein
MKSTKRSYLLVFIAAMLLAITGSASAQGWHHGYHRYRVYRNHHWAYVWHPVGWRVPAAWVGPAYPHHHPYWRHRHLRRHW